MASVNADPPNPPISGGDPPISGGDPPVSSGGAGRAAVNIPETNDSWFFKGDQYVRIRWTPGQMGDTVVGGPRKFVDAWASLKAAGFSSVDAFLPIPNQKYRAYVFSGSQYARIDYWPDRLINGPTSITEAWASLAKAGFNHVDGAIIVPGTTDQAYIFSGENYCRIRFHESTSDDELLEGPKSIAADWPLMTFKTIDTIIPEPGTTDGAYVFSGDKYIRMRLTQSHPAEVAAYWASLHQAGFY